MFLRIMDYSINLKQFSGPFEKLLELVEERKLEITGISLAEVTADFLSYVDSIKGAEPRLLADFIVVASRLVLIKSKVLLPDLELTEEEEVEIKDLESRLKIYSQIKPSFQIIKNLLLDKNVSYSRQFILGSLAESSQVFYPSSSISEESLRASIQKILKILKETKPDTEEIKGVVVSLEEKMEEMLHRITKNAMNFKELSSGKSKGDVVLMFLAILHLMKDKAIVIRQEERFSDIILNK